MSTIASTSAAQAYAQRSPQSPHGAPSAIDPSLSADSAGSAESGASEGTGAARARLDPASMKDRIDGLIADQVDGGSLTRDQADALETLFAGHARSTAASDAAGGPSGPGAPPPDPDTADAASGPPSGGGSSAGTAGGSSASDLLATFIQQLQAAQAGGAGYGASGATDTGRTSALLFDFRS
ncbi:hypothetical protein Q8W71_16045 [Methylobacterium sp. NEAU 140]|uniref:hypothetical protein n=1 Tax=Methylobacterium sp. NEAU 140 TaxID=3064945 RepID=UPI0027352B82|nr:hypothetical protein [Methylobacterium sp. NEAU 140]MDP4024142.1 hypothetical protein [Methylobacterium sp. NEAU 140]